MEATAKAKENRYSLQGDFVLDFILFLLPFVSSVPALSGLWIFIYIWLCVRLPFKRKMYQNRIGNDSVEIGLWLIFIVHQSVNIGAQFRDFIGRHFFLSIYFILIQYFSLGERMNFGVLWLWVMNKLTDCVLILLTKYVIILVGGLSVIFSNSTCFL